MSNLIRGNWTDNPCWYATITDAGKVGFLLGPFPTEASCRKWAYRDPADGGDQAKHNALVKAADKADPRSWFYAWGMVKLANGYREGVLNKALPESEADAVLAVFAHSGPCVNAADCCSWMCGNCEARRAVLRSILRVECAA